MLPKLRSTWTEKHFVEKISDCGQKNWESFGIEQKKSDSGGVFLAGLSKLQCLSPEKHIEKKILSKRYNSFVIFEFWGKGFLTNKLSEKMSEIPSTCPKDQLEERQFFVGECNFLSDFEQSFLRVSEDFFS